MIEDERNWDIRRLISDYVTAPSLAHLRNPQSIDWLAKEILKKLDRGNTIWKKWTDQRELLLKSAVGCWIPIPALREALNHMPGPELTLTDVAQRQRAFEDDDRWSYPDKDLEAGCLEIFKREAADGTEIAAIIGALRDHIEDEHERLRVEREERHRVFLEEDRAAREEKLRSGADCKWTAIRGSKSLFYRANGRLFRLDSTEDKMWKLNRLKTLEDEGGTFVGKYRGRGDASKVIEQMAYEPEPRWG